MLVDPDYPSDLDQFLIDFHITTPSRFTDRNINPQWTSRAWTGGITHTFTRDNTPRVNNRHVLVKVFILDPVRNQTPSGDRSPTVSRSFFMCGAVMSGLLGVLIGMRFAKAW